MPVEIKELIIRAVVDKKPGASSDDVTAAAFGDNNVNVVEVCVRQVLKILKKEKER